MRSEDELAVAQTAREFVQNAFFVLNAAARDERGAEADEVSGVVPRHGADELMSLLRMSHWLNASPFSNCVPSAVAFGAFT